MLFKFQRRLSFDEGLSWGCRLSLLAGLASQLALQTGSFPNGIVSANRPARPI